MWAPSYGCNVGSCSWLQGCSFSSLPKSLCFPLLLQKKSFNLNFSAEFRTGHFGVLLYCRQALGRSESRWEPPALPWWHGCNLCSFCIVLFCSTAAAAEFLCSATLCDEPRLAASQKGSYRVGSLLPLILVLLKELGVFTDMAGDVLACSTLECLCTRWRQRKAATPGLSQQSVILKFVLNSA